MSTDSISPLRQRMIEDMNARKLCAGTQRGHLRGCKRFAAWLKRSLDTATPHEVRRFQLYLIESGASICNRNRIMTGGAVLVPCHAAWRPRLFKETAKAAGLRMTISLHTLRHSFATICSNAARIFG